MQKHNSLIPALALLVLAGIACAGTGGLEPSPDPATRITIPPPDDVRSRGERILELDINTPEEGDYDQVIELAKELGVTSVPLSVYWDEIETRPGVYNPDPNWLAIADLYYPVQGFSVSLVISVLDTTETRLPEDLEGKPFSDPELLTRFEGLLDYIKSQLGNVELISLAIGNEIDGVLGNDQQAWEDFRDFYDSASAYSHELWPGLPVSTKVTFEGLSGAGAAEVKAIYQKSDVVMVTYYPLQSDFSVKDPAVVLKDFQTLAEMFPDQEIHLAEIGYPTSAENGSSPEKQAQFIHYLFQAWDEHEDQITVLSYSWLSDLPPEAVRDYESYYGLSASGFGEFLRTLGLRTYPGSGEDKAGYAAFLAETRARGW